jgi:CRISPR-associated protein (TIGR02584 family)
MQPHEYPRRILLTVSGSTPQVLTETLYALTQTQKPPFVPTEVHILTTKTGAKDARKALLEPGKGWFHRLCREYGLHGIGFDARNIHVFRDRRGRRLEDIRTSEENECAADQIADLVRLLTKDDSAAIHVSISGGRKTMSYYAGYALSLFGREQDRLSHVLVSGEFEGHGEFFYPTRQRVLIDARDPKAPRLDTSKAKVTLGIIPFVRLRTSLDEGLLKGRVTLSHAVESAQKSLEPAELVIDHKRRLVLCGAKTIRLSPAEHGFLAWFARRALEGHPPITGRKSLSPTAAGGYLAECENGAGINERTEKSLEKGMDADFFDQRLTKLNNALRRVLGPAAAAPYLIKSGGRKHKSYFLDLKPGQIHFGPIEEGEALVVRNRSRAGRKRK